MSKAKASKFAKWMKAISDPLPSLQQKQLQLTFKTHTINQSMADILLPKLFNIKTQVNDILLVQFDQISDIILAQVSAESFQNNPIAMNQISISELIVDKININYQDGTNKFKGKIQKLQQLKYYKYKVEFVQICVKGQYISSYDRYRIASQLSKQIVYPFKKIIIQNIRLEIMSLFSLGDIPKIGILTQDTKVIYRTASSNHTFLIQFTKDMFDLDYYHQIYLQRVIEFFNVYSIRNKLFQTQHNIEVIIFAKLYYPQFKTLNQAYDFIVQELQQLRKQDPSKIHSKNLAVAFQKDNKNRVYQDCYRKILWCQHYGSLTQFLWKKMSQFLYTINWKHNVRPLASKILERIHQQLQININNNDNSQKPFIRLLKCQLASSENSNLLQAIILAAQSQGGNEYGINLYATGNAITVLSSGHSKYNIQKNTYRLAKSSIFLTNTSCMIVSLRSNKQIEFTLMNQFTNLVEVNQPRMHKLLYKCLDKYIYGSVMNQLDHSEISCYYENRFGVKVQHLTQITKQNESKFFKHSITDKLKCNHDVHYAIRPDIQLKKSVRSTQKLKHPYWLNHCYFGKSSLRLHNKYYDLSNQLDTAKIYLYDQNTFEFEIHQNYRRAQQNLFTVSTFIESIKCKKKQNKYTCESDIQTLVLKCKNIQQSLFQNQVCPKIDLSKAKDCTLNKDTMHLTLTKVLFMRQQSQKSQNIKTKYVRQSLDSISSEQTLQIPCLTKNSSIFKTQKFSLLEMGPCMFFSNFSRKTHGQYGLRLKHNYCDLGIHYLMPWFSQQTLKNLKTCVLISSIQQNKAMKQFQIERSWKLLCFPLLTPYSITYQIQGLRIIPRQNTTSTKLKYIHSLVGQKLCQGFQLIQQPEKRLAPFQTNSLVYQLIKGHLFYLIQFIGQRNIVIRQCQSIQQNSRTSQSNPNNQDLIKALQHKYTNMLYRYLCYEEKQLRFLPKRTFFKNDDSWYKNKKCNEKKITISILIDNSNYQTIDKQKYKQSCGQSFTQFISEINQKFKYLLPVFCIDVQKDENIQSVVFYQNIQVEKKILVKVASLFPLLTIYKDDTFTVTYETTWNIDTTFNISISWIQCTGICINQFISTIINTAKFQYKLSAFTIPNQTHIFKSQRKFSSPAQIIFSNTLSMDLLITSMKNDWVWDRNEFFFKKDGFGFVKFLRHKKIALWKDNYKQIAQAYQLPQTQFMNFFTKALVHDIIGEILQRILFTT